jgi:hypothetical protein
MLLAPPAPGLAGTFGSVRVAALLAVALPLAGADLALKAVGTTPSWAYHERSLPWVALCVVLLAGLLTLTIVPSVLVPPAAGVLAAGVLGNGLSAAWNGLSVPNPIVVDGWHGIVAFNLADVWVVLGIVALVSVLSAWLVRHRHLLSAERVSSLRRDG